MSICSQTSGIGSINQFMTYCNKQNFLCPLHSLPCVFHSQFISQHCSYSLFLTAFFLSDDREAQKKVLDVAPFEKLNFFPKATGC